MHYAYYIPTLQLTSFGKSLLILLLIWWRNIASRAESSSTQNIWHKIWNHGYIHYIHIFASKTWHSIFLMVVLALARTVIGSHNDGMIFFPRYYMIHKCMYMYLCRITRCRRYSWHFCVVVVRHKTTAFSSFRIVIVCYGI